MGIFKQVKKIISFVENPNISFSYYILLFFSSVTLRNFLEIFSDRAKIPFKLFSSQQFLYFAVWQSLAISFFHYYLFWTAVVLALGIIFSIFTRENIEKVLKSILCFSFIINLTPVVDLIISGGRGINISYIYPKTLYELLPLPVSATPGMKSTFILSLLLSFIYCQTKTNRILKSFLAILSLYITLLFTSLLPFLLRASTPIPLIRLFGLIIFGEALLIFYLKNKTYFLALIKDIRTFRLLHFELMFILGIFLIHSDFLQLIQREFLSFLLTLVSIALAWQTALMLNNLEDLRIDRISNIARPLVAKTIPLEVYKKILTFCFLLALLCAVVINFQTLFFIFLLIGNSILYSLPPLRLKRIPFFSKALISFNTLLLVMLGYIFAGGELLRFPPIIIWYFLIFVSLCMNFIDLKDYTADKQAGIVTLPVMVGLKKAKLIIGGFFLITYSILSLVLLDLRLLIPTLFLGGLQFFLINKRNYQERWILLTHLISLLLLLLYLIGLKING